MTDRDVIAAAILLWLLWPRPQSGSDTTLRWLNPDTDQWEPVPGSNGNGGGDGGGGDDDDGQEWRDYLKEWGQE